MRRTLLSTVAALTLSLVFAPTAAAQNQGPFLIDGQINENSNSGLAGVKKTGDPSNNSDELGPVNGSNTKVSVIHAAATPMLEFTNPNNQTDLNTIWTQTAKHTDGHDWFYFGWIRDASTGSAVIAIEFQQSTLSVDCVYTATGIDMIKPESAAETGLKNTCNPWKFR